MSSFSCRGMASLTRRSAIYFAQTAIRFDNHIPIKTLDHCMACRLLSNSPAVFTPRVRAAARLYSTDNVQGVQGKIAGIDVLGDSAPEDGTRVPEGIQGYECADFKLWLESCRRYGLHNCDEQVENLREGRKTLAQVLKEQDALILQIANDYKEKVRETDEVLRRDPTVQGIQGSNVQALELLTRDDPCPQGVQGENCARFKLWLQNCGRFGFHGCDEQLENYQSGRKTLNDIFREQDELIRSVVKHYTDSSATSQRDEVSSGGSSSRTATSSSDQAAPDPIPLTQKKKSFLFKDNLTIAQRFKRGAKEYGSTFVTIHIGISLLSLGGFYLLVSSGLDVQAFAAKLGMGGALETRIAAGASTFVIAYAIHKVFAPVRIAISLSVTPVIVHHLRRIGFLKLPKDKSAVKKN